MQPYFGNRLTLNLRPDLSREALVSREKVTEFKQWMGREFCSTFFALPEIVEQKEVSRTLRQWWPGCRHPLRGSTSFRQPQPCHSCARMAVRVQTVSEYWKRKSTSSLLVASYTALAQVWAVELVG